MNSVRPSHSSVALRLLGFHRVLNSSHRFAILGQTENNLCKAATRARKKRTSDSEDEDYVAVEDEATSKNKVLKKEYGSVAATKPGMHKKAHAKRVPTSKPRKAALEETMEFTLEPKEAGEGKKRKERVKKTTARVLRGSSMFKDPAEEEEEEEDAPAPKAQKLMGDTIKLGAATSNPKSAPKAQA